MKTCAVFIGGLGVVMVGRALFRRGWVVTGALMVGAGAVAMGVAVNDWAFDGLAVK